MTPFSKLLYIYILYQSLRPIIFQFKRNYQFNPYWFRFWKKIWKCVLFFSMDFLFHMNMRLTLVPNLYAKFAKPKVRLLAIHCLSPLHCDGSGIFMLLFDSSSYEFFSWEHSLAINGRFFEKPLLFYFYSYFFCVLQMSRNDLLEWHTVVFWQKTRNIWNIYKHKSIIESRNYRFFSLFSQNFKCNFLVYL